MKKMPSGKIRVFVTLFCQACIVVVAFLSAVALRYDGAMPTPYLDNMTALLVPLVVIKLGCFSLMRLMSSWWRYVSIHDLVSLVKANLFGSLLFAVYLKYLPLVDYSPSVSVLLIDGLLCFMMMSGMRIAVRLFREYFHAASRVVRNNTERILIVGSGAAGQSIAREIRQNPHQKRRVVGYIDQDGKRIKQRFEGVPVLGSLEALPGLLQSQPISLVILANPTLCHKQLRKIILTCQSNGIKSKILPNVGEMLNEKVSIRHVRDVKLDDLLGRPPVQLDVSNIRGYLAEKRVVVTGAAGSIGYELSRQAAKFGAQCVILFDHAETPLFQAERTLRREFPDVEFIPRLNDASKISQVDYTFRVFAPEVVFHAAAYKHVPMSECNPLVTIENNVLGTRNLVDAADRYHVRHFVMISTDKAVNPTNIMGASKRAAELYAHSVSQKTKTRIVTVRFGNVLGSNGSVVPIFKEQILSGGPVTVTDHRATRFFMTIPEAVQLVMQAGSMGKGGEVFVLDMGEQIEIMQLAEELIRLSGLTPYRDIDIVFTGLRPGEKLHEELLHSSENVMETSHEKIHIARACVTDVESINELVEELVNACRNMDAVWAMQALRRLVPEFMPMENIPGGVPDSPRIATPAALLRFPFDGIERVKGAATS